MEKSFDFKIPHAIDVDTGNIVEPNQGQKGRKYKCPACHNEIIYKKAAKDRITGDEIRRAHFAHKPQFSCDFYENRSSGESIEHKKAKIMIKHWLDLGIEIVIKPECFYCDIFSIRLQENHVCKLEHRSKDGSWIADVCILDNEKVICVIEVFHTHLTKNARP